MRFLFLLFLLGLSYLSFAQRTVSGHITDYKGNALQNVRVLAIDTDVEAFTDSSGNYKIIVPDGFQVLSFSRNNLKTQQVYISGDSINVMMSSLNYDEMSLEELLQETEISVASGIKQKTDEAPAIVSVISSQDIEEYGARDLSDILRLVPGFEFGLDVNSLVGPSFRGIWAFEGKIAFMINGININELGFGLFNLFGTIPASMIERVEIIRGPGSALYGGFAEVAVVNVITHIGEEHKNSMQFNFNSGIMGRDGITGGSNLSIGIRSTNNTAELHAQIGFGHSLLSTREYTPFISYNNPFFGQQTPSSGVLNSENSHRDPSYIVINGRVSNFMVSFIRNTFGFGAQNTWFIRPAVNGVNGEERNHTMIGTKLSYSIPIGSNGSLTPLLEYTQTNLQATPVYPSISHQGNFRNSSLLFQKIRGEVIFKYKDKIMLGNGFWRDYANSLQLNGNPGFQTSPNAADTTDFATAQSYYTIIQYTDKLWKIGTTLGIRSEFTSWGNASAPRIGLTYPFKNWNFKLIQGSSYRVPMLFQAYTRLWAWTSAQPKALVPEKAFTSEFETSYKINKNMFAKLNIFYIHILNPLVFHESYVNADQVKSIGAESEIECKINENGVKVNLSYARPTGKTSVDFLTADNKGFIGIAPLKVNVMGYKSYRKLTFSSSVTYLNERKGVTQNYAQQLFDGIQNIPRENKTYQPIFLLNFNILFKDLIKDKLDLSAAVYNVLDSKYIVIQPYYDLGAPMPANDRHFVINLTWKIGN